MIPVQDARIRPPLLYAETICFIIVCPLMVGLRFYARRVSGSSIGLDDCATVLSLVFVIALAIVMIVQTASKQLGYESTVGDPDSDGPHPNANLPSWPMELIQVPALACVKLSFLLLYRRIFTKRVARTFSLINWTMIAIVLSWLVSFFFALLFLCGTNFAAYWRSSETEQKYCPTKPIHLSYVITDVITDVLIILLPLPEVWKLHLSFRRKLAVSAVFGLGAITIAMSILRLVVYYNAITVEFDPLIDFEYITTFVMYICMLEAGLGLCASCLPVQYGLMRSEKFRDLLRTVASVASFGSQNSSRSGRSHGSHFSRRTQGHTNATLGPHPFTPKMDDSQGSEADISLSTHAAATGHEDVELGHLQPINGIVVTKSFETEAERKHSNLDDGR